MNVPVSVMAQDSALWCGVSRKTRRVPSWRRVIATSAPASASSFVPALRGFALHPNAILLRRGDGRRT